MTTDHVTIRSGAYADSVALLQVSRDVQRVPGVVTAQVAMATPLNVEVLTGLGFELPAGTDANDLVVAIRLEADGDLDQALAAVDRGLAPTRSDGSPREAAPRRTTASALADDPGLVLVSVPGASALVEAMDALDAGCDVMVFSDNVPVSQEVTLKRTAADRGLLVMEHDCGTAVVGGVGLGFANATEPGPVGIVAASGTGCQQVLALLDHAGVGVTSALGVGGRDLSAEVGGTSTIEALRRLDADDTVDLILVVSKPPAPEAAAGSRSTPPRCRPGEAGVARSRPARPHGRRRAGADAAVGRRSPLAGVRVGLARRGQPIRGLFVGGTTCQEARIVVEALAPGDHTFVDFGDDDYTQGRAHPMIDPTLRLEELRRAAADPATGVLLLDVVLGHGAEQDPAAVLAPVITESTAPVVVAVVGTRLDPQDRDRQVRVLAEAGAEVHLSNAAAARRAVEASGRCPMGARNGSSPWGLTCWRRPSPARPSRSSGSTGDRRCPAPRPTSRPSPPTHAVATPTGGPSRRCWASRRTSSTSRPPPSCWDSSAASSSTPVLRSAGTGLPARSAAPSWAVPPSRGWSPIRTTPSRCSSPATG